MPYNAKVKRGRFDLLRKEGKNVQHRRFFNNATISLLIYCYWSLEDEERREKKRGRNVFFSFKTFPSLVTPL
jgi:hypothetical protein